MRFSSPLRRAAVFSLSAILLGTAVSNQNAYAFATGSASLSARQFAISPLEGSILFSDWGFSAASEAHNSLGDGPPGFDDVGSGGMYLAATSYTYQSGSAKVDTMGGFDLGSFELEVSSLSDIPTGVGPAQAGGANIATIMASFVILRADNDLLNFDPVSVEFSALLDASTSVATGADGLAADAEVNFYVEVFGDSMLSHFHTNSVGESGSDSETFAETVSSVHSLQYNTPYFLVISLDAESNAMTQSVVPEPATVAGAGVVALLAGANALRRRTRS